VLDTAARHIQDGNGQFSYGNFCWCQQRRCIPFPSTADRRRCTKGPAEPTHSIIGRVPLSCAAAAAAATLLMNFAGCGNGAQKKPRISSRRGKPTAAAAAAWAEHGYAGVFFLSFLLRHFSLFLLPAACLDLAEPGMDNNRGSRSIFH
jgi:hypothetical protein